MGVREEVSQGLKCPQLPVHYIYQHMYFWKSFCLFISWSSLFFFYLSIHLCIHECVCARAREVNVCKIRPGQR